MTEENDKILEQIQEWARALAPEQARFISELARFHPDIQQLVVQHYADFDELLPTLLMGDVSRWITEAVASNRLTPEQLNAFFAYLESEWGDGQNPVSDLLAVSFVENIYDEPAVVAFLGPRLDRYRRQYVGLEAVQPSDVRPAPPALLNLLKRFRRS
ncbi:DUF7674 family protein [Nocardia ignorata]|uniref:DUF7674 domain-containing protein n=1 Tax=Nocardia ignorata TaxID=145285 RepID=A0A4R6PYX7_NOCIG|nr:hypothetical protein [Nocardia ignorata]TDP42816.1 hypothetical protein DFR75_1011934 [Nocardia ignorata]